MFKRCTRDDISCKTNKQLGVKIDGIHLIPDKYVFGQPIVGFLAMYGFKKSRYQLPVELIHFLKFRMVT